MNKVEKIVASGQCIGCGLCEAVSETVRMEYNAEGFLRPVGVETLSVSEIATITSSCRAINSDYVVSKNTRAATGQNVDFMWGAYFGCKTAFSTDPDLRQHASSGGAISAIAAWMLQTGRATRVLATDYSSYDSLKTSSRFADNVVDVVALSGSKYCPSAPLALISDLLDGSGGPVVVVGRPCDVSTVRLLIDSGRIERSRVAALISFFCAGTPSDDANVALLRRLGVEDRTEVLSFKHRGDGWPGQTTAVLRDGSRFTCTYAQSWGGVLNKDLQFGCKICADGIGEAADIVGADAWYGDDDGYPDFSESAGRSLVMTRTERGQELFHAAVMDGILEAEDLDVRAIDRMQPGQLKRRRYLANRVLALKLLLQPTPRYNKLALRGYQKNVRFKDKASASVGTIIRLLKSMWRRRVASLARAPYRDP